MMTKLYKQSELGFALMWIGIYVVATSIFEELSRMIGIENLAPAIFTLAISVFLFLWIRKNRLFKAFGLCKPLVRVNRFLWFVPLIVITVSNLWFGIQMHFSVVGTFFFVIKMLCVGFLEELIFRGFLFQAMRRSSVKWAVIVSSVTFGIGHIVNLFNGSGMTGLDTLLQILTAIAFGFMYVVIFYRGGSLLPCILSHGILNALSAFSVEKTTPTVLFEHIVLCLLVVGYTMILIKTLPKNQKNTHEEQPT